MNPLLLEPKAILTGGDRPQLIRGGALEISDGRIAALHAPKELAARLGKPDARKLRRLTLADRVALPGFVQTHIHLCQTAARGSADGLGLLDWLGKKIFPYEAALTPDGLRASVRRGLEELLASGTTCIMDMGTLRHTEVIAEELLASGIRACFGKCLIDSNAAYPELEEPTSAALDGAVRLAERWHGREGRLRYAFSPRFLLSCSDELLRKAHALLEEFPGTRFHTHAAENRAETEAVRARCGVSNIEHLDRLGVLSAQSCLAHCVWVSDAEMKILGDRNAHVLHCPGANLKLASGVADIAAFLERDISVSLGADGAACNNSLHIWNEMRLASLLPGLLHGAGALGARKAFELATIGGARALGWEADIGSLEAGKAADVVFLDLSGPGLAERLETEEDCFSALVFCGRPDLVTDVMIDGRWIVRERRLKPWW